MLSNPAPIGQKTKAGSVAVVLASDSDALPVSGTVAVTGVATEATLAALSAKLPASLGIKTAANSLSIAPASDAVFTMTAPASATGTHTNVASSASNVTLLASNASRKGAIISNDSTAILYVKFGATATATSYAYKLYPDGNLEVPFGYTGIIDGIWVSANGFARVTEMT